MKNSTRINVLHCQHRETVLKICFKSCKWVGSISCVYLFFVIFLVRTIDLCFNPVVMVTQSMIPVTDARSALLYSISLCGSLTVYIVFSVGFIWFV